MKRRIEVLGEKASGQVLTMALVRGSAVSRVDASGCSSFRARGTTAHREAVLRL